MLAFAAAVAVVLTVATPFAAESGIALNSGIAGIAVP